MALLGCAALFCACVESGGGVAPDGTTTSSPLVSLSATIGEVGMAFGAVSEATSGADPSDVAYASIDDVELDDPSDPLLAALRDAVATKQSIFVESNFWDHEKVDAVGRALFGVEAVESADSALLLAEWVDSGWMITRGYDPIADRLNVTPEVDEDPAETLRLGGSTTISFLVPFARAAYDDNEIPHWTRAWRASDNVATIWTRDGECVLAWRGSATSGDWTGNVDNQITALAITLIDIPFDALNLKIVGHFYQRRLSNIRLTIQAQLNDLDCRKIHLTGHSLGGAMALYTAYAWSYMNNGAGGLFSRLGFLRAFNPARVGNSAYRDDFNARVPHDWATAFCRTGDPVRRLPEGFVSQCSFFGARASWKPWVNHQMKHWTKCENAWSC